MQFQGNSAPQLLPSWNPHDTPGWLTLKSMQQVQTAHQFLTFPAPITFSAAYTESPHLEHFSAPPNFWANFEVFGFVVGR